MKNLEELLSYLQQRDIQLWAEGEKLRYNAPKGVLTSELQQELKERKAELLSFLQHKSGINGEQRESLQQMQNIHLEISSLGNLHTLHFHPTTRPRPNPGEVEIEPCVTGLNFKDVLIALGMFPFPQDNVSPFGLECAGRITAVGEGVDKFQIGDEVIAFSMSCFSYYVIAPADLVVPKPRQLCFEEAATIPVAFMTAYYALVKLAHLSQGERVLIHAAAGGVGMAAVKIAQWIGAEIFATASSQEKHDFLRSLGVKHIMNSRTLDFADTVMEISEGKGVDVVLNSLSGEFIPKSLSLLAPYGRFLEIGRRDIHENRKLPLRPFERSLSFFAIMIGPELPHFSAILHELMQHFEHNHFSPLPYRTFQAQEISYAFEYMFQAKHIGKIVISLENKESLNRSAISAKPGGRTID